MAAAGRDVCAQERPIEPARVHAGFIERRRCATAPGVAAALVLRRRQCGVRAEWGRKRLGTRLDRTCMTARAKGTFVGASKTPAQDFSASLRVQKIFFSRALTLQRAASQGARDADMPNVIALPTLRRNVLELEQTFAHVITAPRRVDKDPLAAQTAALSSLAKKLSDRLDVDAIQGSASQ